MALLFANNNSLSAITTKPSGLSGGSMNLISTLTADNSATTLTFSSGIDNTYDEYVFKFINMHCAAADGYFQANFRDGGTNYDATKTTTFFKAQHNEGDSDSGLSYSTGDDLAQSTGVQRLSVPTGNDNDISLSGTLQLFSPASTIFVKHFISNVNNGDMSDYTVNCLSLIHI